MLLLSKLHWRMTPKCSISGQPWKCHSLCTNLMSFSSTCLFPTHIHVSSSSPWSLRSIVKQQHATLPRMGSQMQGLRRQSRIFLLENWNRIRLRQIWLVEERLGCKKPSRLCICWIWRLPRCRRRSSCFGRNVSDRKCLENLMELIFLLQLNF